MKPAVRVIVVSLVLAVALSAPARAGHSLGGGVEYLKTVGDIKDAEGFDSNAFGFIGSYQFSIALVKLEGDVEWVPDFGGSGKSLIQPQAYALIGGGLLYGGLGIGTGYIDGGWWSNPFYALRAGVNLGLAGVSVDVFGLYRFQNADYLDSVDQTDLDSITFGALLRFDLGK
jgi:hypothetical protein